MLGAAVTATILSLPPLFLIKYLDFKCKSNHTKDKLQQKINEDQFKFMFVTDKNRLCSPHLIKTLICGNTCSYLYLKNIVGIINDAKETICLCMYHFSVDDVYRAIVNAHHRGVHIRVISDMVMLSTLGSKIAKLCKENIPAKTPKTKLGLMHHKFLIIDGCDAANGKVAYGSLNYTMNGFINNWEYLILASSVEIVKRFQQEFDFLWENDNFTYVIPDQVQVHKRSPVKLF